MSPVVHAIATLALIVFLFSIAILPFLMEMVGWFRDTYFGGKR